MAKFVRFTFGDSKNREVKKSKHGCAAGWIRQLAGQDRWLHHWSSGSAPPGWRDHTHVDMFLFFCRKTRARARRLTLQQDQIEQTKTEPQTENAHRTLDQKHIPEALLARVAILVIGENSQRRSSQKIRP